MASYKSKTATVSKQPAELYMGFADMRNFLNMLPEDKKQGVTADYDTLSASVQGMNMGIRVTERVPYSKIVIGDNGAPFQFQARFVFDAAASDPFKTDFHIELDAELNFMMKMMIGSKLQDALDKIVQGIADASEGKMPEGVDPSMFKDGKFNF